MRARLIFIVILLFTAACSGLGVPITSLPTPRQESVQSSPATSLLTPTFIPTQQATVTSPGESSPIATGCTPTMRPAAFLTGGDRLLGFWEKELLVYDLSTHSIETDMQMPGLVFIAAITPDGKTIAAGMDDFSIQLIRVSDQKVLNILKAFSGTISGLAFSPDGSLLLSASEDSWVRTFSMDGQEVDAFQPLGGGDMPQAVMGIGILPDWTKLATIPVDGYMSLWSLPRHNLLGTFEGAIYGGYSGSQAAFSPDGKYLAQHLGAGGGPISLWRITDGKLLVRGENIGTGVDFSLDGRYLAYGEMLPIGGSHIVVRTPDGGQVVQELVGPKGSQLALPLFTPDGEMLVAVDYVSGKLMVWTIADGQRVSPGDINCQIR